LNRNVTRRLERLEAQTKVSASTATRGALTITIVDPQGRIMRRMGWENGKCVWTYFDEHGTIERVEPESCRRAPANSVSAIV